MRKTLRLDIVELITVLIQSGVRLAVVNPADGCTDLPEFVVVIVDTAAKVYTPCWLDNTTKHLIQRLLDLVITVNSKLEAAAKQL